MYEQKNLTYILTVLESIEKIFIYTDSIADAELFFNKNAGMNFNARQALLLVIGEESKKLDEDLKAEHNIIPWHLISGLRNRIAHDYRSIDPFISFDIIKNYLPDLKTELLQMLKKVDFDEALLLKALDSSHYQNLDYLKN